MKIEVKAAPEKEFWLPCRLCARTTRHEALTHVWREDSAPDGSISWWDDFHTVRCCGCFDISFLQDSTSDDWFIEDQETGQSEPELRRSLYPARVPGIRPLDGKYYLPWDVQTIYIETVSAINSNQRILAGIGIRAIVESVAKNEKAKGKSLEKRIDDLKIKGFITPTGAELLHDLRFMGNAAAHEVKAHTQEELAAALRVVDHLLTGAYVLPREHRPRKTSV